MTILHLALSAATSSRKRCNDGGSAQVTIAGGTPGRLSGIAPGPARNIGT
jgi:hypothetical protein